MIKSFLDRIEDNEIEIFRVFWNSLDHTQCLTAEGHKCVHNEAIVNTLWKVWPWVKEPIQMGILYEFVEATLRKDPIAAGNAIHQAINFDKPINLKPEYINWQRADLN